MPPEANQTRTANQEHCRTEGSVVLQKRSGLQARRIDGETVILDSANERMHCLNATAAFIFEAVDGRRSVQQIWEELAESYQVSPQVAERDTLSLLEQLRDLGIIE